MKLHSKTLRPIVINAAVLVTVFGQSSAFGQNPAPLPQPASESAPPAPASSGSPSSPETSAPSESPPPSTPSDASKIVTPEPGQAAASAPSPRAVPITATCSLGDHPGIDDDEARTAADVLCHELAIHGATNADHEVRFGKLGGKVVVTVASRNGNTYDERRTLLSSMEELSVAAPRLAKALAEGRPFDDTKSVDNVLASETRQPKVQKGQMGFDGGVFGATALGATAGGSGGIHLGLLYRAGSFGVSSTGRFGGIGSSDRKVSMASLDIGTRYYLTDSEVSPFLGLGLELAYFNLSRKTDLHLAGDWEGSGFGGYGQLGAEFFRSHHAALSTSLRVDAPFFALEANSQSRYIAPVSLNIGVVFR